MIDFVVVPGIRLEYDADAEFNISADGILKAEQILQNASGTRFSAFIGDICDGKAAPEQSLRLIGGLKRLFGEAEARICPVMGECDSAVPKQSFMNAFGFSPRYRAIDVSDYRCIFLDTLMADPSDPYSSEKSDGRFFIDDEQLMWVSRLLGRSHRTAVIFSNVPIFLPEGADGPVVENGEKLREVIEKSKKVSLVISGRSKTSGYTVSNGVPYISLSDGGEGGKFSFARVSVSSRGVSVSGFGDELSFSIENLVSSDANNKKKTLFQRIFPFLGKK